MNNIVNLLKESEVRYYLMFYISFLFVLGTMVIALIFKSKFQEDEDWKKK